MLEYLVLFLIANSFFLTIFPMILLHHTYDSLTDHEKEQSKVSVDTLNLMIPVTLGVLFPLMYSLMRSFIPRKVSSMYLRFNLAGATAALIISLVIDNIFGIYETWFEYSSFTIHISVFVLYFILFQLIGVWVYKKIAEVFSDNSPLPSPSIASSSHSSSSSIASSSSPSSLSSKSSSDGSSLSSKSSSSNKTQEIVNKYFTPPRPNSNPRK